MKRTVDSPLTTVWLALLVIAVGSWWFGVERGGTGPDPSLPITIAVLALGLIKARLIIRYFMEVRAAPTWLRAFTDIWLVLLWGGVLGIYLA
ncbi:cytochrome C oxidase subunit IV family protein [Actinomadura barringtoniae]|uniref:Cytochrome C oxidase subunit IV family protein n=1 Tax=Actinomadura barringtoniae TaxID=1427535 RepID=A0A939PFQ9_9ACTN|nr:cytochrome C oxidase subunit IV family protein [Actinomadura barringtoniae]MBO2447676.1 cytochrome C oxidase subunit IV family protein [Actinomadura barringtoniae]